MRMHLTLHWTNWLDCWLSLTVSSTFYDTTCRKLKRLLRQQHAQYQATVSEQQRTISSLQAKLSKVDTVSSHRLKLVQQVLHEESSTCDAADPNLAKAGQQHASTHAEQCACKHRLSARIQAIIDPAACPASLAAAPRLPKRQHASAQCPVCRSENVSTQTPSQVCSDWLIIPGLNTQLTHASVMRLLQ